MEAYLDEIWCVTSRSTTRTCIEIQIIMHFLVMYAFDRAIPRFGYHTWVSCTSCSDNLKRCMERKYLELVRSDVRSRAYLNQKFSPPNKRLTYFHVGTFLIVQHGPVQDFKRRPFPRGLGTHGLCQISDMRWSTEL